MNFRDCVAKGMIKKDVSAPRRVQKSVEIAERFLSSSKKNLDIDECEMAEIAAYNAIFHASRALLFHKKYTERSHVCVIIALKELYKDQYGFLELVTTFDKIRISRHNIQYGGMLIDRKDAEFVHDFAIRFIDTAKNMLNIK